MFCAWLPLTLKSKSTLYLYVKFIKIKMSLSNSKYNHSSASPINAKSKFGLPSFSLSSFARIFFFNLLILTNPSQVNRSPLFCCKVNFSLSTPINKIKQPKSGQQYHHFLSYKNTFMTPLSKSPKLTQQIIKAIFHLTEPVPQDGEMDHAPFSLWYTVCTVEPTSPPLTPIRLKAWSWKWYVYVYICLWSSLESSSSSTTLVEYWQFAKYDISEVSCNIDRYRM